MHARLCDIEPCRRNLCIVLNIDVRYIVFLSSHRMSLGCRASEHRFRRLQFTQEVLLTASVPHEQVSTRERGSSADPIYMVSDSFTLYRSLSLHLHRNVCFTL